jgi:hypothetical protein
VAALAEDQDILIEAKIDEERKGLPLRKCKQAPNRAPPPASESIG